MLENTASVDENLLNPTSVVLVVCEEGVFKVNGVKVATIVIGLTMLMATCAICRAEGQDKQRFSPDETDSRFAASGDLRQVWQVSLSRRVSLALNSNIDSMGQADSLSPSLSLHWPTNSTDYRGSQSSQNRSDRYKNTHPAVFRLTLKGYSIVELKGGRLSDMGI